MTPPFEPDTTVTLSDGGWRGMEIILSSPPAGRNVTAFYLWRQYYYFMQEYLLLAAENARLRQLAHSVRLQD